MESSSTLNKQHIWGGAQLSPLPGNTSNSREQQTTNIGHVHRTMHFSKPPLGGFVASFSDDLFHPTSQIPFSNTFTLPNIPFNPNPHYSLCNRCALPPHPPSSTSYNNPHFSVPPLSTHGVPNPITPCSHHMTSHPLDPPPPVSPRPFIPNQHAFEDCPQPHFSHFAQPHGIYPQTNPIPPSYYVNQEGPAMPPHTIPPQDVHSHPTYCPHQDESYVSRAPSPSSPPPSSFLSLLKTLPSVAHIPLLTSKHNFFPWDEGVQALIHINGLLGHILDPSTFVDPHHPDLCPTPPPILTMSSSPQEIELSNWWWAKDNVAQHILITRLGTVPRGLLPSFSTNTHTALSIYQILTQYYGTCNFADCTELLNSLHNSTCTSGRVLDYVSK